MEEAVLREFTVLTDQIEISVKDLNDGMEEFLKTSLRSQEQQNSEIASLQFKNHIIRTQIESQEQWMKQIAFEILDSEQGTLIVAIKAIWALSLNSSNAIKIIHEKTVINSITDLLTSQDRKEIVQASLGVLTNLAQNPQSRQLFVDLYDQHFVARLLDRVFQIIGAAIDPFSKTLELALIFVHNFTLNETIASLLRRNCHGSTLVVALDKVEGNVNLFDTIISILNTLYRTENDLNFLSRGDAQSIAELVKVRSPTSGTVQLMTTMRIAFPNL
jgi:hypothetical protein